MDKQISNVLAMTKINRNILLGIVLLCCLMFASCRFNFEKLLSPKYYVYGINESKDTLVFYLAAGFYMYTPTAYPDTMLPKDTIVWTNSVGKASTTSQWMWQVPPNEKSYIGETYDERPIDFYKKVLPCDTLSVFIMSKDTLNKYGYDDVAENNRILVRYDLSIRELELIDDIPYPPTPRMRDVQMSPSYDYLMWERSMGLKP